MLRGGEERELWSILQSLVNSFNQNKQSYVNTVLVTSSTSVFYTAFQCAFFGDITALYAVAASPDAVLTPPVRAQLFPWSTSTKSTAAFHFMTLLHKFSFNTNLRVGSSLATCKKIFVHMLKFIA